jgi:DNA-binding transcriptional ArsR family regulator
LEYRSMKAHDSDLVLLATFFHSAHYHLWQALRLAEGAADLGGPLCESMLVTLFAHALRLEELAVAERTTIEIVGRSLAELRKRGLVDQAEDGRWKVTPSAHELVEQRRANRVENLTTGLRQLSAEEVENVSRATNAIESLARAIAGSGS